MFYTVLSWSVFPCFKNHKSKAQVACLREKIHHMSAPRLLCCLRASQPVVNNPQILTGGNAVLAHIPLGRAQACIFWNPSPSFTPFL